MKFAVIFDFDGTLMDSYTFRNFANDEVSRFLLRYIKENGYKVNHKKMLNLISKIENEMTNRRVYDRKVWFAEALKRYLGNAIQIPSEMLTEACFIYWNTIIDRSFLYGGVKNLLQALKRKKILLGLLSDTDSLKGMKSKRIEHSGLGRFFDAVVIAGEDTEEVKPDKLPFVKIVQLLGVPPKNCIFVGDYLKVDVLGAKKLGMKTIIIQNKAHYGKVSVRPDYILRREKFDKLEKQIDKMFES